MAEWSEVLPAVSRHCPGSNPGGVCEKVASDLGLGGVFSGYSGFLNH